jgi:flagella basal body P-ring formation protein FlgA
MARRLLISMHMPTAPKFCRIVRRRGRALAGCLALLSVASVAASANADTATLAATGDFQELAPLEAMARLEAALQFPALTSRQRFVVGPIESHLQLAKCSRPVTPVVATPHHMQDRVMIELRCPDTRSWHIYVQVRIVGTSPVAVTTHAIIAGTVLKASDLKVEEHDLSDLPLGFLDDPAIAVGLTASRPIAGGIYLTNQQVVAPKAVIRGQSVTLMADTGGMSVRMAGRALGDGLINQRVRVQNLSSGKIVEGIARSEQTVEIISQ